MTRCSKAKKPVNACVHTYTKSQTPNTRRRGPGWRIHGSVEDTKLSSNKQHTLSQEGTACEDAYKQCVARQGTAGGRLTIEVTEKYAFQKCKGLLRKPQLVQYADLAFRLKTDKGPCVSSAQAS